MWACGKVKTKTEKSKKIEREMRENDEKDMIQIKWEINAFDLSQS